jgi:DNA (cytosine-5)-methyltransferase 1
MTNYVETNIPQNKSLKKESFKLNKISEKKNEKKISIGEMYCGPGGIGYAAKNSSIIHEDIQYKFTHRWATDYHADTCMTYENNIAKHEDNCDVIHADITKYDISKLPNVDGFLYGFPCNDFSITGETKGLDGKFGPLYTYGVNYINKCNPKFFFAENVSGMSSANSGAAFKLILKSLAEAGKFGYKLTINLYKFEDYGVPQARHRIIIIGMRSDLGVTFKVPKPNMKRMTVKECIEKPPIEKTVGNQEKTRQSATVVERLKHIKPGENAWTADIPEHLQLNVKGARMSMIYKRLDPDKPSYTVTGSGGGGTHVYHWDEPRALTNRERARIQTFPDDFAFFGSKESVRRQIGMAVPVEGAKIILKAVLKTIAGKPYESVDASHSFEDLIKDA